MIGDILKSLAAYARESEAEILLRQKMIIRGNPDYDAEHNELAVNLIRLAILNFADHLDYARIRSNDALIGFPPERFKRESDFEDFNPPEGGPFYDPERDIREQVADNLKESFNDFVDSSKLAEDWESTLKNLKADFLSEYRIWFYDEMRDRDDFKTAHDAGAGACQSCGSEGPRRVLSWAIRDIDPPEGYPPHSDKIDRLTYQPEVAAFCRKCFNRTVGDLRKDPVTGSLYQDLKGFNDGSPLPLPSELNDLKGESEGDG